MPRKTTTAVGAPVSEIPLRPAPPCAGEAVDGLTLTVVVCAYTLERWDDLTAAVDSVRGQVRPADEFVLVVDHCPELAARARALLPGVRVVASRGRPGLSGARNTGIAEARGSILAFLDDDAVADPQWTRRLLACYSDRRVLGVGGSIRPRWDARRPAWFPAEFDWVVGCTYRGMPETRSPVRNILGANMSFRREVLMSDGGFRSDLGRARGRPLGCEETELCIRAAASNPESVLIYEPGATVRHRVPRQRATWSYFRARCFAEGLSKAAMVRQTGTRRGLSTERSYMRSTIPSALLRPPRGDDRRPRLATAPAVVAGVAVTAVGYLLGRLSVLPGVLRIVLWQAVSGRSSR
jgi:GT2 family glycosyltransferase